MAPGRRLIPRRATPEADLQRSVVRLLRLALPGGAIVHHSPNEQRRGGDAGRRAQGIATGMGVHPGFADLIVLSEGRVLFLELKSPRGRVSDAQAAFAAAVRAQGHAWEVVRSLDDALAALARNGFRTAVRSFP